MAAAKQTSRSPEDSRPRSRIIRGERAASTRAASLDVDLNTVMVAGAPAGTDRIEAAVAEGYREGYQQGLSQGRAEGLVASRAAGTEQRERLVAVTEALAAAAEDLVNHHNDSVEALAHQAVDLALELAEAIVGRELELSASPGRDAIVRAMAFTPDNEDAVVRLHPDDAAALGDVTGIGAGRRITIVADDAVERGGCLVAAGDCRIDAQIGPALERARVALRGESGR